MAERALVDMKHVSAAIAGATVLQDVTLRLMPGERLGVVGANGSGKTTLLKLITGSLWPAPDSGPRIYDFGRGPERDAVGALAAIQYVGHELQDRYIRLGFDFFGLDIVLSGLYGTDVPRRRPDPQERHTACEMLRALGIAKLAERRFLTLSRGEQRRLLIARALAAQPAALVLDEPASGLDARARADLDRLLEAVPRDVTIVVSAHTDRDLPRGMDRVLYVHGGRLAAAPPAAVDTAEPDPAPPPSSPAAGEPLVVVENASVYLDGRRALEGLHFRLEPGQQWLVRGGNGAGKSTFLRLLHGQLRPATGGSISWPALGDPRDVWTLRRQVGWVAPELQANYKYPTNVRECIASGFSSSVGVVRAPTAAESARIAELLETFDLTALAARPLTALSYGQARRALLARAFAQRPRLLLLDEPWEGLDERVSTLLERELASAIAAGTHVVCASHLAAWTSCFTHELRLEAGRVTYAGPRVTRPR